MDIIRIIYAVFFFLFGITIGSFLNVCIYRIPKNETIITVPSHCTSCGHKLNWLDLFPLFSWLFLGGKCRYCKAKISFQYPLVELLNGLAYLGLFLYFGLNAYTVFLCIFFSALIIVSGTDIREGIVLDSINLFILILGIIYMLFFDLDNWSSHLIGFFSVSVPLIIIALLTGGMGMGDVKLYAAAGFFLGWKYALLSVVIMSVISAISGIIFMIFGGGSFKSKLRLVPFITVAILITVLCGDSIINWYLSFFEY
ncbi:MAG: prepilin peptidase [Firmicutes bacterium]|nr:prepilin peptidase [Bacillota bacterium]